MESPQKKVQHSVGIEIIRLPNAVEMNEDLFFESLSKDWNLMDRDTIDKLLLLFVKGANNKY